MKITKEDYKQLSDKINGYLDSHDFTMSGWQYSELSYKWEVFHRVNRESNFELLNRLFTYLNDKTLQTAINKVFEQRVNKQYLEGIRKWKN